jgi:hypothetical protein
MSFFAIVKNNVIINTIVAEKSEADLLSSDELSIVDISKLDPLPSRGWEYNSSKKVFTPKSPGEGWIYHEETNTFFKPVIEEQTESEA